MFLAIAHCFLCLFNWSLENSGLSRFWGFWLLGPRGGLRGGPQGGVRPQEGAWSGRLRSLGSGERVFGCCPFICRTMTAPGGGARRVAPKGLLRGRSCLQGHRRGFIYKWCRMSRQVGRVTAVRQVAKFRLLAVWDFSTN